MNTSRRSPAKLAFVTPWYGEFSGGAEVIVREAAENLAKLGIPVEVLTTCSRSPYSSWWQDYHRPGAEECNGVVVRRFSVNTGTEGLYHEVNRKVIDGQPVSRADEIKFMRGSISSDAMAAFIKENKDDYVFILSPYLYGLIYWVYRAAPGRCALLPCLHDEAFAYFSTTFELMGARKILFYTPEEYALARRIYKVAPEKCLIIGGGVAAAGDGDPGAFAEKYRINYPYLLYVGRKDRGKNVTKLVEYFNRYKGSANDDLKLIFIGGGDDSLVPKNDHFIDLGFVDKADKDNAYAGALATCLLSENESFSLVIMESWLHSTPVVVSDICDVTRGHCVRSNGGLYVANFSEFEEVIRYLAKNPGTAKKMGANGRKYVLDNYSWEKVIPKYMGVLKEFEEMPR